MGPGVPVRWWWLLAAGCAGKSPDGGGDADADTDTDTDTDADTDTDTDTDADTDTEPGHSGDPDCGGAFVGDAAWQGALRVTHDGSWCATFDESRSLEQELALKGRLTLPTRDFPMPTESGTWPFRLPVCFETRDGSVLEAAAAPGEIEVTAATYGAYASVGWSSAQDVVDGDGEGVGAFALSAYLSGTVPFVPDVELDGVNDNVYRLEPVWMTRCGTGKYGCASVNAAVYVPCDPVGYDEQHHQLGFDGGEVDLRLDIGGSYASTEPASFRRATGTLDGVAFDVTDYFDLVYNPSHHHFQRDFAVFFAAPIGGACGLAVRELGSYPDTARVERVECDLTPIDTRAITSNVHVP
jgi:hypothetical protein